MSKSPENINITPFQYLSNSHIGFEINFRLNFKEWSNDYILKKESSYDLATSVILSDISKNFKVEADLILLDGNESYIGFDYHNRNFVDPDGKKYILNNTIEKYEFNEENPLYSIKIESHHYYGELEITEENDELVIVFNELSYEDVKNKN